MLRSIRRAGSPASSSGNAALRPEPDPTAGARGEGAAGTHGDGAAGAGLEAVRCRRGRGRRPAGEGRRRRPAGKGWDGRPREKREFERERETGNREGGGDKIRFCFLFCPFPFSIIIF